MMMSMFTAPGGFYRRQAKGRLLSVPRRRFFMRVLKRRAWRRSLKTEALISSPGCKSEVCS